MPAQLPRSDITGAVLAGGEGRRMGGVDKGLVELAGKPLTAWVLDALRPQTGALLINANRSLAEYRAFGVPVVADSGEGFQGPLAGLHAVLCAARTDYVLTAPCDAPRVPADLAARLSRALCAQQADIAVAKAAGRVHPVHALLRRDLADDLAAALAAGERKVMFWLERHALVQVDCDDIASAFVNVNTPEELDAVAAELTGVAGAK